MHGKLENYQGYATNCFKKSASSQLFDGKENVL